MNVTRRIINYNKLIPTRNVQTSTIKPKRGGVSSSQYCLDNVRKYDYENFLCTLLLNGNQRRCAFAIRAFNVEVSRISSVVSDDKIGMMRLKFWEDAVEKIYDTKNIHIPDHPVVLEVKKVVDEFKLSKRYFQRLVNSRNRPSNSQFVTTKQLEDYSEQSVSSIYYLLLETAGIKNVQADHAASHLGKSQGIVNILRSIPLQTRATSLPIPQELLIKHGVSQERILRDKPEDKGVEECIFEIAGTAHQHLEKSRSLLGSIPKDGKPLLLSAVAIERYLERLRKSNFHLSDKRLHKRDTMLPLAFYLNKIRGKY